MKLPYVRSAEELCALVNDVGCLPLFRGSVPGFSVEEITPEGYWFTDDVEGPWNWRVDLASSRKIAYAKLFNGKYGFASMKLFSHLANYRRDGYDFDARVDDGLVRDSERRLYTLIEGGMTTSMDLRRAFAGKGFESALAALQMRTYVTCAGFTRRRNRQGVPYGWEIACYETAESVFGEVCSAQYDSSPEDSLSAIIDMLRGYLSPDDVRTLLKM